MNHEENVHAMLHLGLAVRLFRNPLKKKTSDECQLLPTKQHSQHTDAILISQEIACCERLV